MAALCCDGDDARTEVSGCAAGVAANETLDADEEGEAAVVAGGVVDTVAARRSRVSAELADGGGPDTEPDVARVTTLPEEPAAATAADDDDAAGEAEPLDATEPPLVLRGAAPAELPLVLAIGGGCARANG